MRLLLAAILCLAGSVPAGAASGPDLGLRSQSRLLVAFKPGVGAAQRHRILGEMGLADQEDIELDAASVALAESQSGVFRPNAISVLQGRPEVLAVEQDVYYPNWLVDAPASAPQAYWPSMEEVRRSVRFAAVPMDADLDPETTLPGLWGIRRVNAPAAWVKGDGRSQGAGVRVGIIDTGVDCGHPDLSCDPREGYNALDPKKEPMDDNGHGTHVAGTIAAKWDGVGIVGVAPQARVVPIKVLDGHGGGSLSSIIKGLVWAANHRVQVANMSLGAPVSSVFMHLAVAYANLRGVVLVVAAGNSGPEPNTVSYPGAYREVIAVAASGRIKGGGADYVAYFSSRGPQVAFIAPGVDVYSCALKHGYATHSGTSMATPHMAGLAALAVARGIRGTEAVRAAFRAAAKPIGPIGDYKREEQGFGMVDAAKLSRR